MTDTHGFRTLRLRTDTPEPAAPTMEATDTPADTSTDTRDDTQQLTARQAIHAIAEGVSRTSSLWTGHVRDAALISGRTDPNIDALLERLPGDVMFAVQVIYEGYLMHEGNSRVLRAGTPERLELLIGDYCHAAGITELADAGRVQLVELMAHTIARTATAPADQRDAEWITSLEALIANTDGENR